MRPAKLEGEPRAAALASLLAAGWTEAEDRDALIKRFVFRDFSEAFGWLHYTVHQYYFTYGPCASLSRVTSHMRLTPVWSRRWAACGAGDRAGQALELEAAAAARELDGEPAAEHRLEQDGDGLALVELGDEGGDVRMVALAQQRELVGQFFEGQEEEVAATARGHESVLSVAIVWHHGGAAGCDVVGVLLRIEASPTHASRVLSKTICVPVCSCTMCRRVVFGESWSW